ncbi:MAG: 3-phosphoshikimate 1-carboxyvinyltransferase [Caulobacterales bacterium]|jgi:3-phosphoshikimate 1-carboxyvinyltransferase
MRLIAFPGRPLAGTVRPPGDKSISHRALMLGAAAEGQTRISGLLESADVLNTAAAMAALGADMARDGADWIVRGRDFQRPAAALDFGNSGTGARLCMGLLAGYPIAATFVGDASLSKRPMARILEPLALMGAQTRAEGGRLPVTVIGRPPLTAIDYASKTASAQVKSAVLLAGLHAEGVTRVSEPARSRDHTENMLAAFGADIATGADDGGPWASVRGGARLVGQDVRVPGDPSSAAFFLAAGLIVAGSDILVEAMSLNPLRIGFVETIAEMGADVTMTRSEDACGESAGSVRVRHGALRGVAPPPARAASMIDEYPILAALAAFADGETRLTGAEELRVKESDRIALMARGLRACGVEVDELPDGLVIQGRGPGGVRGAAEIETEGDHRIAMSFLVLGLGAQQPVTVDEADMIATSFPDFAARMAALGADIRAG